MTVQSGSNTPAAERDAWRTPSWLFAYAEARWGPFDVDLAADAENHLCPEYLTLETDSLAARWDDWGRAWLNPPYSNISPWIEKAAGYAEARSGLVVVMLIPTPNGESYYEAAGSATDLVLIQGRISFFSVSHGREVGGNARGSCFLVFGPGGGPPRLNFVSRDEIRRSALAAQATPKGVGRRIGDTLTAAEATPLPGGTL